MPHSPVRQGFFVQDLHSRCHIHSRILWVSGQGLGLYRVAKQAVTRVRPSHHVGCRGKKNLKSQCPSGWKLLFRLYGVLLRISTHDTTKSTILGRHYYQVEISKQTIRSTFENLYPRRPRCGSLPVFIVYIKGNKKKITHDGPAVETYPYLYCSWQKFCKVRALLHLLLIAATFTINSPYRANL